MQVNYSITIENILEIHENILNTYWWLKWVNDQQQIESILQHIQNNKYYPSFIDKTTHLFFWLIKFHCFIDWNKRIKDIYWIFVK